MIKKKLELAEIYVSADDCIATGPALGFRKPGPSFRKHVKSSANSIIVGRRKCRGMLLHRHIGCFVRVGDRDVGGGVRRSVVGAWAAHPPALFR